MRKFLSTAVTLFTVGTAFAQTNISTISQTGTSLSATVGQTGAGLTGAISQTATNTTDNSVSSGLVTQAGTGHNALIYQNDGSVNNKAVITQSGSSLGNIGFITQSNGSGGETADLGNSAGIQQTGAANQAGIFQDGAQTITNTADVWQSGTANGRETAGARGHVYIDQSESTGGRVEIYQGDDTKGNTVAGTSGTASRNGAQIDQQGGSQNNSAFVRQFSNDNNARVRQEGSQSSGNIATITQRMGDNNTAYVDQGGSTENFGGSISNQATILQSGQNGTARIQQFYLANNGIVTITQGDGGSNNEATVAQFNTNLAGNSNTVTVNQNISTTGSGNKTIVLQGTVSFFDSKSEGNKTTVLQEDSDNYVGFYQTGQDNTASIEQRGNGNSVLSARTNPLTNGGPFPVAVQSGNDNQISVNQQAANGTFNVANIEQTGVSQVISISQTAN